MAKKLRKCEVILLSQLTINHPVGMKTEFNSYQALRRSQPSLPERTDDSSDSTPKADNIESSENNHTSFKSTNSEKISSSNVISHGQSTGRETNDSPKQGSKILSDISANLSSDTGITMADNNVNVVCSTDISTELLSKSDHVTDQSSKKSKRIILCDETFIEEIFFENDSQQCHSDLTLWITFDRHILQMTDKAV